MSDFPIDVAQSVALFMESILYGVFLVTFGLCIKILIFGTSTSSSTPGNKAPIKWNMVVVAVLMFIWATLDLAFGLRHNLVAFIYFTGPGGAKAEFAEISYWPNVMKAVTYVGQTALGDGILIYRCWIVYNKRWSIVILPIVAWIACTVCGCFMIDIEATLRQDALLGVAQLTPFITSLVSVTLALNISMTSLIAYKIWTVNRETAGVISTTSSSSRRSERLSHVMRIIIESGLIYSLSIIIFFAVYFAGSNAQYGVSDCVVQIIGIVFNIIIIRVHQGATTEFAPTSLADTEIAFARQNLATRMKRMRHPEGTTISIGSINTTQQETTADNTSSTGIKHVASITFQKETV